MRRISVLVKIAAVVSGVIALTAYGRQVEAEPVETNARAWLGRIQAAAQRLDYSGTFVYQQGDRVRASRIVHVAHGSDEVEKLEVLDGRPREYIRTNDDILYYLPEAKTLVAERNGAQAAFPAILKSGSSGLARRYDIAKEGAERIAGLSCQVIALRPKDDLRYGYRLWAEKSTGLLLRAQTLDRSGAVIEQIAFTQVAIGDIDRGRLKPSVPDIEGWRVENAVANPAHLSGWTLDAPPGFSRIREVRRRVSDTANANGGAAREISQIVLSDGLAAMSVFIEPDARDRAEGSLQQGAMSILTKHLGNFWITIVGEVPPAAVKRVADSIEFKSK